MRPDDEMIPGTFLFDFVHVDDSCACPGKQCHQCKQIKCFGAFNRYKRGKYGLQAYCRLCGNTRSNEYYEANREKINETRRRWRQENPERDREYNRAYY